MSIITIFKCDLPSCGKKLEILEGETPGAETILEVNDAVGKKVHFCCVAHLRAWAATYTCPYRKSAQPKRDPLLDFE